MRPTNEILLAKNRTTAVLYFQPFLDPERDLSPTPNAGSFYIVSYVESGGHKFTMMLHLMLFRKSGIPLAQMAISILDEDTKHYFSEERNYFWLKDTSIGLKGLNIATPECHLFGDIDKLMVEGHIVKGSEQFDMKLKMMPLGPFLPNLVTGIIPLSDGIDYQFALPRMETSGEITVQGKKYQVKGWSWLDREWGALGPSKWTWMNIQLDNDVQTSLWDEQTNDKQPDSYVGGPRRFATIMNQAGDLVVSPVVIDELGKWKSTEAPGRVYANKWRVTIPSIADLLVESLMDGQEIVSPQLGTNRVEAKAQVMGIYNGQKVAGVTMVEMFDLFPLFK